MDAIAPIPAPMPNLTAYLSASRADYERCMDAVQTDLTIAGITAKLRFKYLKFTPAGEPAYEELARALAKHIVDYCLSSLQRSDAELLGHGRARMIHQARELFRQEPTSGEAGELLLYFLQEAVLGAPQLVTKMSLKGNPAVEVLGSDGIHALWDAGALSLYFGESKLYGRLGDALDEAFASLERFHNAGMLAHEIPLVTAQFKYADERVRVALLRHLQGNQQGVVHLCHSLLIGHDWDAYGQLQAAPGEALLAEFLAAYRERAPNWAGLLQTRFNDFTRRDLRFEVFVLPFRRVQEFRDAVIRELIALE